MTDEIHRGHEISILDTSDADAPSLTVDGESIPFTKNDAGYHIFYTPAEPSLIEAARSYVNTRRRVTK